MSLVTLDAASIQRLFSAGRAGLSQLQTMIHDLGLAALQSAVSYAVPDPLSNRTLAQLLLQSEILARVCPFPEDELWVPQLIKPAEIDDILQKTKSTCLVPFHLTCDLLSGRPQEADLNHLLDLFVDIRWSDHEEFLLDTFYNDPDFFREFGEKHDLLHLTKAEFKELIKQDAGGEMIPNYLSQKLNEKLVILRNMLIEQRHPFLQRAHLYTTYMLPLIKKVGAPGCKSYLASLALQGCHSSPLSSLIAVQNTLDALLNHQLTDFDPKFYELRMRFAFETLRLKIIEETYRAKKRELDEEFQKNGRPTDEINQEDLSLIQLLLALRFYPFHSSTTLKMALLWHGDEFSTLRSQMHEAYTARLVATIEDVGSESFKLWFKSYIPGHPTLKADRKRELLAEPDYTKFYPLLLFHLGILQFDEEWAMV